MGPDATSTTTASAFERFVGEVEPRLRRALTATYGPTVGREAALDALSWAWEHWDRMQQIDNRAGYLYRVGQSAATRLLSTRSGALLPPGPPMEAPEPTPELAPALGRLSEQQRATVMLVHGYGMSLREVADVLGISVSTVREHVARGMDRLRAELEDRDDR